MDAEERAERVIEMLCLPRTVEAFADYLDGLIGDVEEGVPPCEMTHSGWHWNEDEGASRVVVVASVGGPPCGKLEVSDYVDLVLNGAGTVVGAVVEGAPTVDVEV